MKNTQNISQLQLHMKLPFCYLHHSDSLSSRYEKILITLGGVYGCELCQAVQVHKRYRDLLWLWRQGSDLTEYTAFLNYAQRQSLEL